jgi:hypothetical protein
VHGETRQGLDVDVPMVQGVDELGGKALVRNRAPWGRGRVRVVGRGWVPWRGLGESVHLVHEPNVDEAMREIEVHASP